ncbi:hypothetical protein PV326_000665 [Microctonus aethiopoides]|nr:hypothetical protein PV326_000665 [Microctonus aethiopoides]
MVELRRHRSGVRIKSNKNICSCSKSKVQLITLWLAAILITFWLIALSWLAGVLYGEIRRMDVSIKSGLLVVARSSSFLYFNLYILMPV